MKEILMSVSWALEDSIRLLNELVSGNKKGVIAHTRFGVQVTILVGHGPTSKIETIKVQGLSFFE